MVTAMSLMLVIESFQKKNHKVKKTVDYKLDDDSIKSCVLERWVLQALLHFLETRELIIIQWVTED